MKPSAGLTSILTEREIEVTTLYIEFYFEKRFERTICSSVITQRQHTVKNNEEIKEKKHYRFGQIALKKQQST
jgi:hypothetical protein